MRPGFLLFLSLKYLHDNGDIPTKVDVTSNMETMAANQFLHYGQLQIYYPDQYESNMEESLCKTATCSHLCVHSNSYHGYKCLCPMDMELASYSTCKKKTDMRLITSGSRVLGIHEVPLQYIGLGAYRPRLLVDGDVGCFAYGPNKRIIVYHNNPNHTLEMTRIESTHERGVLYHDVYSVEGIVIAEAGEMIYWTNRQGQIIRGYLDGSALEVFVHGLDKPRGIAVDEDGSHLYVCDWRRGHILRCDRTRCEPLVETVGGQPNNLIIHTVELQGQRTRSLIWTDSKLDTISVLPLEGNMTQREINLNGTRNPHPYALAAIGDNLVYYTDWNSGGIHVLHLSHPYQQHDIGLELGSLFSLAVFMYGKDEIAPTVLPTPVSRSTLPPSTDREPVLISSSIEETTDVIWVIGVTSTLIVVAVAITVVICFYKQRHRKSTWLSGIMKYVKDQPRDDAERLMSHIAASNPSIYNFEELDYPETLNRLHHGNGDSKCSGEYSTISMDSAFNEMQDFSTSSADSSSTVF